MELLKKNIDNILSDYALKIYMLLKAFTFNEQYYAKKTNRVIYDITENIIENIDISNINNNKIYTGWNLFPIDINNYNNLDYSNFIRKVDNNTFIKSLPIYYIIVEDFDNYTVGSYIGEYTSNYLRVDISFNLILIKLNRLYLTDIKLDLVTIFSHELLHAFDDNIIYNKKILPLRKKCMLTKDVEDIIKLISYNQLGNDIFDYINQILYFISQEEIKARENELSSAITYLVRTNNFKRVSNNKLNIIYNLKMSNVYNDMRPYFYTEFFLININNLISILAEYPELNNFIPISNSKKIIKLLYKILGSECYNIVMFIIGIVLCRNKMFNFDIDKTLLSDNIKKLFIVENILSLINGDLDIVKYLDFVFNNVLYIICRHLNNIYKILFDCAGKTFEFSYTNNDMDIRKSLNEDKNKFFLSHFFNVDVEFKLYS